MRTCVRCVASHVVRWQQPLSCPSVSFPRHQPCSCPPHLPPMQVLKDIPLYVVTNDKVGLLGTRECAIRIVEQMREELTIAT